jgi:hypothetical protein
VRTIIAGSRKITDYAVVEEAVRVSCIKPSVVLSGCARGVDALGEQWARQNGVPINLHRADWTRGGRGGPERNQRMAENADVLIAVWDGKSRGTADMIRRAKKRGLVVHVHQPNAGQ